MGWYLLDHGQHTKWSSSRNGPVVGGIIHCTAGLDVADEVRRAGGEWAGIDRSAERTYEWCATTTTASSWHDGTDWDSHVAGLPLSHRAWHCRGGPDGFWRDYNDALWGLEISKTDMTWHDEYEGWVAPTLATAAEVAGARARQAGFPIRHITRSQLDAAIRAGDPSMGGFVGHRQLDPDRRSDPGSDFPWDRFLDLTENGDDDMPLTQDDIDKIATAVRNIPVRHRDRIHGGPDQYLPMHKALSITQVNATVGRRGVQTLIGDLAGLRTVVRDALADAGLDDDVLADKIVTALAARLQQ